MVSEGLGPGTVEMNQLPASSGAAASMTGSKRNGASAMLVASANSATGSRRNGNWTDLSSGSAHSAGIVPTARMTQPSPNNAQPERRQTSMPSSGTAMVQPTTSDAG